MGWWRINPKTGMPLEGASSALSKPPDMVLLNAVPGVDDQAGACYLGDGPSDMVSTMPDEIDGIAGDDVDWTPEAVRALFSKGQAPAGVGPKMAASLRQAVKAFWDDIDSCYEDDWDRTALPAEKRWICEEVVERMTDR